jgi:hypothetical protein
MMSNFFLVEGYRSDNEAKFGFWLIETNTPGWLVDSSMLTLEYVRANGNFFDSSLDIKKYLSKLYNVRAVNIWFFLQYSDIASVNEALREAYRDGRRSTIEYSSNEICPFRIGRFKYLKINGLGEPYGDLTLGEENPDSFIFDWC